jgi:hypothetical protein
MRCLTLRDGPGLERHVQYPPEFWVISVDNGGLRALSQNQVIDNGILFLPSGTIQESPVYWHTKGWE